MRGEALGPVKARCPSVGNARVLSWEWVTGKGSLLIEVGGVEWEREKLGKGITFEISNNI